MRVLIASDDTALVAALLSSLRHRGHAMIAVGSAADAEAALAMHDFDLVVLDLTLAHTGGASLVRGLRARSRDVPLVALAIGCEGRERIAALDAGADDCVGRPFSIDEIHARIRVWSRRDFGSGQRLVRHGPLSFDVVDRVAYFQRTPLKLSRLELTLMEALMRRAGRSVSKDVLIGQLHDGGFETSMNGLEVYMHRLRKKLPPGPARIATRRGIGYCLEMDSEPQLSQRQDGPVPAQAISCL